MEKGGPLESYQYPAPPLRGHEVRIAITHCGICATDIQAIDDYYDITDYPFIPGHEIVGFIIETGKDVAPSRLGERVGVGWQGRACGSCEWCLRGQVHLCQDVVKNASWKPYGGFSTSICVDSEFAYRIPEKIPSEHAAVLMCAGITVFKPLWHHRSNHLSKIGIVGVGGLGHLAIQFARSMNYEVTAISTSPDKREEALGLGADHFLVISDREEERQYGYYFDLILCTAHGSPDWERILEILKKRGSVILTGFPDMHFRPIDLVAHELSISGSFLGVPSEMHAMLRFSQENGIIPKVELMPMKEINQAITRLRDNKVRYRVVLYNEKVKD